MPVTILRTLKPHNDYELKKMLEQVYGINPAWVNISFDEQRNAVIEVETVVDIDARIAVSVLEGGMKAELSLFPAINKGKMLTNEDVENYLIHDKGLHKDLLVWENIKHAVQYFLAGYMVEKTIVAEGLNAVNGEDASIELMFEVSDKKPKILEDGSADFREINKIVSVDKDQLLISYKQETNGTDGMLVTGNVIPAKRGKKLVIHKGRGVYFDEERQGYAASEAGHVVFDQNRISVNPIYSVPGDVDFSVGNIDFNGTVSISGDVLSGFVVKGLNVVVWGIVKDATIIAKNNINIKTGVRATGKSHIEAGNDLSVGFMENATVYAGSSVNIRYYSLYSRIYSDGEINAYSGDGFISGGELKAFSHIRVRKLGAEQGPSFKVFLGVKYSLSDRLENEMAEKDRVQQILKETDDKIRKMVNMNPDVKKDPKLKSILFSRGLLLKKFESADEKVDQLIRSSMHPAPYLRVDDTIYDGVTLVFYGTEKMIGDPEPSGKFVYNKNTGKIEKLKADAKIEDTDITEVKLDD